MAKNPFSVDPWEVAKAQYEQQMHNFMVALLNHFKVTQVELDLHNIVLGPDHAIEMRDLPNGNRFYRIIGKLEMAANHRSDSKGVHDG